MVGKNWTTTDKPFSSTKNLFMLFWRAYVELWMLAGSLESTKDA